MAVPPLGSPPPLPGSGVLLGFWPVRSGLLLPCWAQSCPLGCPQPPLPYGLASLCCFLFLPLSVMPLFSSLFSPLSYGVTQGGAGCTPRGGCRPLRNGAPEWGSLSGQGPLLDALSPSCWVLELPSIHPSGFLPAASIRGYAGEGLRAWGSLSSFQSHRQGVLQAAGWRKLLGAFGAQ